jgi:hypothetical protein
MFDAGRFSVVKQYLKAAHLRMLPATPPSALLRGWNSGFR